MTDPRIERLAALVEPVQDFPKPGILFRDITPLLANPVEFGLAIEMMSEPFAGEGIEAVLGIESRGFIFAAPIALRLGAAFIPVRKPGKLPRKTTRLEYALEYGTDALEMHEDALRGRKRVLLVDDVIATGGTARATLDLARLQGAEVVGASFLVELSFLSGAAKLDGLKVASALRY